jgi:hypothetical protein
MPHLMNCGHDDHGWCLDCVKELGDEAQQLQARVAELERFLREFVKESEHKEATQRWQWLYDCHEAAKAALASGKDEGGSHDP